MSILPQHWSKKEITNVSPSRYNTSCFLALISGVVVANHRQLATFDVDRRLLQPGARHHTAFRPDGGSLSGATPTLSAQIISPYLCFFYSSSQGPSVWRFLFTFGGVFCQKVFDSEPGAKCASRWGWTPSVPAAGRSSTRRRKSAAWTRWVDEPRSFSRLAVRSPPRQRESGGGERWTWRRRRWVWKPEREGKKETERERKDKKTFLWSVPKCNNKESIVQRGESLGSGAVQFSLNCAWRPHNNRKLLVRFKAFRSNLQFLVAQGKPVLSFATLIMAFFECAKKVQLQFMSLHTTFVLENDTVWVKISLFVASLVCVCDNFSTHFLHESFLLLCAVHTVSQNANKFLSFSFILGWVVGRIIIEK